MILQRRPDEDEELQTGQAAPAQALSSPGQAQAASAQKPFQAIRQRFVPQGQLQQANAGVLERQREAGAQRLRGLGDHAEAAVAGVEVPGQKQPPRFTQGGAYNLGGPVKAPYAGPEKADQARGFGDAVAAIQAWQGAGDDAAVAGTRGDALNEGLLGIDDAGRGAFSGIRSRFAGLPTSWASKQAQVQQGIDAGIASRDMVRPATLTPMKPEAEPVRLQAPVLPVNSIPSRKDVEAFAGSVSNVMFTPFKSEADASRIYSALPAETKAKWSAMTPAERAASVSETARKLGIKLNGDW